jgi:hypothetical protein
LGECVIILQNGPFLLQQGKMLISKLPVIIDAVKVFKSTHHGVESTGGPAMALFSVDTSAVLYS